jgi:hypothetical protein
MSVYKDTEQLCTALMKNHFTLKGQKIYESFPEYLSTYFDELDSGIEDPIIPEEFKILMETKSSTDELPHLAGFPLFVEKKESKMYLTQLELPSVEKIESFRRLARIFLRKYAPQSLYVPNPMQEVKHGHSKYYDGDEIRIDDERPSNSWSGPFLMQRFMTGPLVHREVWLPHKAYKCNSTWWHIFTNPILNNVEDVCANESSKEFVYSVCERFRPCRKIDLKGFGIQFPREYAIVLMEEISEMFPSLEVKEHMDIAKRLFSNMSVKEEDGTYVYPKRGLGLGYYTNLMTLAVRIILQDCYIIKMFNDDMLIDENDFEKAISYLEFYLFMINLEKTGKRWQTNAYLGGVLILSQEMTCQFFSSWTSQIAAIFNKRYHWERKQLMFSFLSEWKPYTSFHYEKIFGYEFFSSECMNHPDNLGVNSLQYPVEGYYKHYDLARKKSPLGDDSLNINSVLNFATEGVSPSVAKDFHNKRKNLFKYETIKDVNFMKAVNPDVELLHTKSATTYVDSKSTPMWSEIRDIYFNLHTSRKFTHGEMPSKANKALRDNKYARDPYLAFATGGSRVTTPWYIDRPPKEEEIDLAHLVSRCGDDTQYRHVHKRGTEASNQEYIEDWECVDDPDIEADNYLSLEPENQALEGEADEFCFFHAPEDNSNEFDSESLECDDNVYVDNVDFDDLLF